MKRLVLLVALVSVVLAACSGGGDVVASVNGTDITLSEVEELSGGGGSVPEDRFVEDLRNLIVEVAVFSAADQQFGITFGDDAIDQKVEEIRARVEADSGSSFDDFMAQQGLTEAQVRRIAHQQLVVEAVQEKLLEEAGSLTEQDIQDAYDARKLDLTEACVRHILTQTEQEALDAKARVEAGEDFAAVAAEVSIDPSVADNQGNLGCGSLGQYVPEFAAAALEAPIGKLTGPVRSQFGYHILIVDSRTTQSLEEVRDDLVAFLEATRGPQLFQEWLVEVVNAAQVEIDPKYGKWVTTPVPQVLPPG